MTVSMRKRARDQPSITGDWGQQQNTLGILKNTITFTGEQSGKEPGCSAGPGSMKDEDGQTTELLLDQRVRMRHRREAGNGSLVVQGGTVERLGRTSPT